jgi:uncharacterized membrane protein
MEIVIYFLVYLVIDLIIAAWGSSRKIGFFGAFLVCLFLTPFIGVLVVALSGSKKSGPSPAHQAYQAGMKAAYMEEYPEALRHFKEVLYELDKRPRNTKTKKRMQQYLEDVRKVNAKIEEMQRFIDVKKGNPSAV